ncbi:hypothetical protein CL619_03225 [archaeon]|nr:hypothetical protein [archaeon]|tara:strand:- start:438 stop:1037 length:600 start_codon:yes stop_codon:yes gene_type:complete
MSLFKKIKSFFIKEKQKKEKVVYKKPQKQLSKEQIKIKQTRANQLLKKQLEKEKQKQLDSKNTKKQVTKIKKIKEDPPKTKTRRKERINISEKEQIAENLATNNNNILFIQATTKRLKVIEWRNTKKRIILNREREIRRTHKGGWSQEKFQRFVDSQKAKTFEWVEKNLQKPGVLRGPYDEILVETNERKLENEIKNLF